MFFKVGLIGVVLWTSLGIYAVANSAELGEHAELNAYEVMECMDQVREEYPKATGFTFHEIHNTVVADFVVPGYASQYTRMQKECIL